MRKKSNLKLIENNKLLIEPHGIIVQVQKKEKLTEFGTTKYAFSYSFKGSMINNPINPKQLINVAKDMAKLITKQNDQILIALDRGGTALGVAVSMISKFPVYIAFSYFTKPPKNWIWWEEIGYGKSLAIPPLPKNTHVILIDDEINTGLTYISAIQALRRNFIYVDQIVVVFEICRKKLGREVIKKKFKDVKISSLYNIPEPIFHNLLQDYVFSLD